MQTDHYVQTFHRKGKRLTSSQPERCKSLEQALVRARRAAEHSAGAAVISVTGEPEFGEFGEPVLVAHYGEIAPGLSPT